MTVKEARAEFLRVINDKHRTFFDFERALNALVAAAQAEAYRVIAEYAEQFEGCEPVVRTCRELADRAGGTA